MKRLALLLLAALVTGGFAFGTSTACRANIAQSLRAPQCAAEQLSSPITPLSSIEATLPNVFTLSLACILLSRFIRRPTQQILIGIQPNPLPRTRGKPYKDQFLPYVFATHGP